MKSARAAGWVPHGNGVWSPPIGKTVKRIPPVEPGTKLTIRVGAPGSGSSATFVIDDRGRLESFVVVASPANRGRAPTRRPFGDVPTRLVKAERGHVVPASVVDLLDVSEQRWNMFWQGMSSNRGEFGAVHRAILGTASDELTTRIVLTGKIHWSPTDPFDVTAVTYGGYVATSAVGHSGVAPLFMETGGSLDARQPLSEETMDTTGFKHQAGGLLAEAIVRFAPDWMDLFSIAVEYDGSRVLKAEVIVPPLSPAAPELTSDARAAIETAIADQSLRYRLEFYGVVGHTWLHATINREHRRTLVMWALHPTHTPEDHILHYLKARDDKPRLKALRAVLAAERRRAKRQADRDAKSGSASSPPEGTP